MRTRAVCCAWSDVGSPGSRATSFHTCQVLRPRRVVWTLAFTRPYVLPSAFATASAPGIRIFARLNGWPVCSPTDASPPPLRATAHGSGPMWLATPSSYRTCTDYSLPVSRHTAKDSGHYLSWRRSLSIAKQAPTGAGGGARAGILGDQPKRKPPGCRGLASKVQYEIGVCAKGHSCKDSQCPEWHATGHAIPLIGFVGHARIGGVRP
jgi:hypothetical protein